MGLVTCCLESRLWMLDLPKDIVYCSTYCTVQYMYSIVLYMYSTVQYSVQ